MKFTGDNMSDAGIDRRDYGMLEQQVKQLTEDVHMLKENIQAMRDLMEQSKGGWRTLVWLGGVAGTIGAMASWIAAHVKVA
jgi:hypothetical protein